MEFIAAYTSYVERELKKISIPDLPLTLYDPIRYFLQIGGKRMRPVLTLLGAELFGLGKERAIHAALAVEIFHNFTLIHDDIMDAAPLRRGYETVHIKWNSNTAILSGDMLMIKAYQLLEQQEGNLRLLLEAFNKTSVEICEGQQMDMDYQEKTAVSISDYIEMIRLKTSVLLGCALELAAIIANASEDDRKHIYNFGVYVGLAFQIQDDILDLYADPDKFGKQTGGDVIANKKTILYLLARENASDEQLKKLNALSIEQNGQLKVHETRQIFDEIGVKNKSVDMMNHYFFLAQQEMNKVSVPDKNKLLLNQISEYLLKRDV
ncbi:MAG: polyprenyl synthetase family protein [Crocinitomicaceae bacterium]|nr:polyprenyl synthetase family protein [Crocinitomicaceae bacterium]NGF74250.1 polyprenyl synthetase family protein [Fluviicola sp. SGL-29]